MVKIISISEDVYEGLVSLKRSKESFSEVIRRLVGKERRKGLLGLAGIWKENTEMLKIMKSVIEDRKNFRLRT
ncbi:MAG: antitoxin VapB family protein [Nanoarchaeota archaeon]